MSFVIPIIAVFGFYNISTKIRKIFNLDIENLKFSLILFLILLASLTLLVIFGVSLKPLSYLILSIFSIFFCDYIIKNYKTIYLAITSNKKIYFLYFFLSIISLIPLAGADSYAYHLAWPNELILNSKVIFNKLNLEYRVVGNGEIINYLGLLLYSQNLQSFLSVTISFFYILTKKEKNFLILIFLTSPIFLKYLFDQKPFFLPCILLIYFIENFFTKLSLNKINNFDLIGFFLSLFLFMGSKYPFLVIGSVIFLYFLKTSINFKFFKKYIFFGFFIGIFYFLPIPLIKFIEFGDPFSPFLEGVFNHQDKDILKLKLMYQSWDGLRISENSESLIIFLRNLFNFLIPIAPFSVLDTYGISFLIIFFLRFNKLKFNLISILLVVITIMVITTNFQSRWYLFFVLLVIFSFDRIVFNEKNLYKIKVTLAVFAFFILGFYIYFLSFVIFNSISNGFEDTKNKTIYLYKEVKELEKISKNDFILTNTRSSFFSDRLIQYRYPSYSIKFLKLHQNYNDIEYGLFAVGSDIKSDYDIRYKSILKNFNPRCYSVISNSNNLVAKRNLFSRKDYERFIVIKFKEKLSNCFSG